VFEPLEVIVDPLGNAVEESPAGGDDRPCFPRSFVDFGQQIELADEVVKVLPFQAVEPFAFTLR
jgi:hypothetical protein